jgi:hypothetical protein
VPNISPKRHRPKSGVDRERLTEINRLLNRTRLPDAERAVLQAEKDRLSPIDGPAAPIDDPVPLDVVPTPAEGCFQQAVTAQPINDNDNAVDKMTLKEVTEEFYRCIQQSWSDAKAARVMRVHWRLAALKGETSQSYEDWVAAKKSAARRSQEEWETRLASASPADRVQMQEDELFYRFGIDK